MERFWEKVDKGDGCWLWTAFRNPKGYGMFPFGREQLAHRVAFLLSGGELPPGAVVHHKCGVKACVNPDHLEVVESTGAHSRNHKSNGDLCLKGHKLDYVRRNGTRWCRTCGRDRARARRLEKT